MNILFTPVFNMALFGANEVILVLALENSATLLVLCNLSGSKTILQVVQCLMCLQSTSKHRHLCHNLRSM